MKCKLDICRIQWLNREFLPYDYAFKYNKNESRFTRIFNSISNEQKINDNNRDIQIGNSYISNYNLSNKNNVSKSNDIDIKKILSLEERRKTLMIKNIPNKFTINDFLRIFSEFNEKFNLFLIPTDIKRKKNYGYAYINFIEPLDIIYFYYKFNGKRWANTNSIKICEILFSKIQGNKIIKHFPIKNIYLNPNVNENENNKLIIIPLCYLNIFKNIYPQIEIKMSNVKADIFLIEKNILDNINNSNSM
jgi:RNA recognition motif-containing protein